MVAISVIIIMIVVAVMWRHMRRFVVAAEIMSISFQLYIP